MRAVTYTGRRYRSLIFVLSLVSFVSAGCSKPAPTTEQVLSRANDALAAGQFEKAEKDYREVLRLTPTNPVALRQLGIIYFDQGQLIQAHPLLKRATELQPDDLELQLKLGQTALAFGQLPEARDLGQQVLTKKPGDETALLLLVDTAVAPEEIKETQKLIESQRDGDQDRASYHLALGLLDARQSNEARAENQFKAAIELDPKSSAAYSALGRLYWSQNDLKAADEAMKTAADLGSMRSAIQMRYVDFKLRQGALREAKGILEGINTKFPDYLPARVALMKIVCAEQADENCAARVQGVLAQDPINFDAQFQDSVLKLVKGDTAQAMVQFENLTNAYRGRPKLLYQLAVAYLAFAGRASPAEARDALDKAAHRLNEAIKLDPRYSEAILTYAELQIRSGNAPVVIESLVQLVEEQPQIAEAHYLLAAAYRRVEKESEALAVLQRMTKLFPKDPQPPFGAGSILLAQGKKAEARQEFEKSAEISPDYLPATEAIVELALSEKQYAAAMDRVQRLIEKNATLAQLWGLRGKIQWAQEDATHAEADLLKAIALDPKFEPAYLFLAEVYASSNRPDKAVETLNGFVEKSEKSKTIPALLQLARVYEQVKNFPAARDAYEKLLTVSGSSITALNNLALIYAEHLGQLDAAYEFAKKAREAAPNEPSVADTLGWILFKKGDYANARRLLQEGAGKLPDRPELQFHLGMAHYMLGDEVSARVAMQKSVDSALNFAGKDEARQRLGLLAMDAGTAGARTELQDFLRRWPNDPLALTRLAQVQLRDGAADQAVKTFEKIVADNPLYRPALRQLALLYGERSADDSKAYELVLKARQEFPDDVDIAKTLGILSYRHGYYPRSLELLKEAVAKRRDDPELFYYFGEANRSLRLWGECKGALERALALKLSPKLVGSAKQALIECS